ncbi:hypothetical protein L6303_00755 [archaeon]|nr:hypothetical protein [Nanoarchaeota archaeon]MBU4300908.1 hypothetical protein [Nanoarchaeota archaeon]MBU4451750.1 hypothetical protein [Nanoarchaeota archaeon]MCG2723255.1 hypothetical protein [archaeon]
MKILVFLHGTTIMHKNAVGHLREEIIKQVVDEESSVKDYASYIPVGNAPQKLQMWKKQGAEILYLSSHRNAEDVEKDKIVLKKYKFPEGKIFFCKNGEEYNAVAERIMPDLIIEDDCESIGGISEMTHPNLKPEIKAKIKSIVVKEFAGIDNLPDKISKLII